MWNQNNAFLKEYRSSTRNVGTSDYKSVIKGYVGLSESSTHQLTQLTLHSGVQNPGASPRQVPNNEFVSPEVVYGEATFDSRDRIGSPTGRSVPAEMESNTMPVKPDVIKALDLSKVFDPKNIDHERQLAPQDDDTLHNEVEITVGKPSAGVSADERVRSQLSNVSDSNVSPGNRMRAVNHVQSNTLAEIQEENSVELAKQIIQAKFQKLKQPFKPQSFGAGKTQSFIVDPVFNTTTTQTHDEHNDSHIQRKMLRPKFPSHQPYMNRMNLPSARNADLVTNVESPITEATPAR